jgi:hypothetical protein
MKTAFRSLRHLVAAILLSAPLAVAQPAAAPSDASSADPSYFNFESVVPSDVMEWAIQNESALRITTSADRAFLGARSLKIEFEKVLDKIDAGPNIRVGNLLGAAGKTVTFRVWLPADLAPRATIMVYTQVDQDWRFLSRSDSAPKPDGWTEITLDVPFTDNVRGLGVWLQFAGAYSGTFYIDAVDF